MAELTKFKCKGSYGFHYGMGVEDVEIDFENIAGLVALVGGNGMSKTTLLELLSPFPVMPSRKKKDPKRYNFKKQFMLRDSYVERHYEIDGKLYVFRNEIPATTTMGLEGYITCDGVPLVKGKITEYKKKVVELFGSETLFYSSYFSCQGGDTLIDKSTGDFKQLLIELLGLNKYNVWWHSVGKVITAVSVKLDETMQNLSFFNEKSLKVDEFKEELKPLIFDLNKKKDSIEILEKSIAEAVKYNEDKQTEIKDTELAERLVSDTQKEIKVLNDELFAAQIDHEELIQKIAKWIKDKRDSISEHVNIVEDEEKILKAEILINDTEVFKKKVLGQIDEINKSLDSGQILINETNDYILKIDTRINELQNDEELSKLITERVKLREEYATAKDLYTMISNELATAKNDAPLKVLEATLSQYKISEDLLDKRPDSCVDDTCPFILVALENIKSKPDAENAITVWNENNLKQVNDLSIKWNDANSEMIDIGESGKQISIKVNEKSTIIQSFISQATKEKGQYNTNKQKLDENQQKLLSSKKSQQKSIEALPGQIEGLWTLAGLKPRLEVGKKIIAAAEKDIEEQEAESKEKDSSFVDKQRTLHDKINKLTQDMALKMPKVSTAELTIELNANTLILSRSKESLETFTTYKVDLEKQIAILEDKAKMSEDDTKKIADLKAKEQLIRQELKKWDYIRAGLSKSGLQALEIASAAPLLTGLANDLLHEAFGGELYLELITVDPETGAEILDIMVTREDGETFMLSVYSGGESVWILQSFKAAQILVNAEKSGIECRTCYADEETGSLDPEKAEKFTMMYRALIKKGNFEKLIFISHLKNCQAMADHALEFKKGGIEIS